MKRPLIGSQVIRTSDPLRRIGVILDRTEDENVIRYSDGVEQFDKDVPFEYVGWSDPRMWHAEIKDGPREANKEEMTRIVHAIKTLGFLLYPMLTVDGFLFDGRNRMLACHLAGKELTEEDFRPLPADIDTDAAGFTANIARRMLNSEDIKSYLVKRKDKIAEMKADAQKRKSELNRPTAERISLASSEAQHQSVTVGRIADLIGAQIGVSGPTVERIFAATKREQMLIDSGREDLVAKVKSGAMGLTPALIEAGVIVAPEKTNDPIDLEVCVCFYKKHLKAFTQFAKENAIVWSKN